MTLDLFLARSVGTLPILLIKDFNPWFYGSLPSFTYVKEPLGFSQQPRAIRRMANVLLIDEVRQMSIAQCVAMVACLPKLEKVLLTGDAYQLPAYAHHLKGQVLDGGLESVIVAVQRRKTVPTSALSVSYRPHPAHVDVQKALYSGSTREREKHRG
ncbi:hypothetical protein QR680_018680 [Steinernema hermaphroditum]|uniref:Uncharacterized protein n=1 Tax=Steinernema hermaphroditum TaxID=289476 RepID=A0AA39HKU3_9BILA|nr:hypothetical protein QR680_018680 [Steinernema hermaphroditum]